ncbi:MAG: hypothetical protein SCI25_04745 [Desulfuromonadales bacterium]|nr:hypothetical protein [Desulfuromonadales bacterium]MDW7757741.1 hypothetical protein [Desulfuromonadales bacterium]
MARLILILAGLLLATPSLAASKAPSAALRDVYFGEALYHAYQGEWFDAIARLDTELGQYYGLDEPELDTLHFHVNHAKFSVGDFELAYRMHHRAGRAISAVIEGNVEEPVRNEAIYRLSRIYFQKDQPVNALHALERLRGEIPSTIRDDVEFLRGQILLAVGRFQEAAGIFKDLQGSKKYAGFSTYNLGIALIKEGQEVEGRQFLDRTGQLLSEEPATLAIKDKANLALGYKLLDDHADESASAVLERVRLNGPFSNRALLGWGWADASQGRFERALVPWNILAQREVTDPAVQEALLAAPYAYGKLNVFGRAAVLYGKALEAFGQEIDRLSASIKSVREGKFLEALTREELKQDANWVVKLRQLPETPETYYLLELMSSHDFQESLKNYLDLDVLEKKLSTWEGGLDAFEDIIRHRRAYYEPLLPEIDQAFRQLDSQIRLRLEQRDRIEKRLQSMLVAPRPDYLATAQERIVLERLRQLEQTMTASDAAAADKARERIKRLRGLLAWDIATEYDQRLTETYKNLDELNEVVEQLKKQYNAFVRTRQAATQSYEGYGDGIGRQRILIAAARERVRILGARQGDMLETMAVNELSKRRERLEQYQITARFAIADSYDRATKAQNQKSVGE